jgi:hypothetical protein
MKTIHWLMLFIVLGGCKDKYDAPVHIPASGYLVVEGFINVGNGSTDVTLTRATGLDSPYVQPEPGAVVSVVDGGGNSFVLTEIGDGKYSVDQLQPDLNQKYKLHINTANGKEYESDFTSPKITPPIDSISWKPVGDGVWIYVTTHDPTGNSRYYQWNYEETWEYQSAFISSLEYAGAGTFTQRPLSHQVHICYTSDISTSISIGSTAKLNEDVMYEYPLTLIPYATTNKLSKKYSILVKQYVLTKEWYEWKEKVKKNTEQLGSIFDAQPSDISGNIHCVSNPGEPVIGYIGCSSETELRIFISREQLPQTYIFTGYEDCLVDTIPNSPQPIEDYFDPGTRIPLAAIYAGRDLIGYTGASNYCVDCQVAGGVLTKPAFWQ